MSTPNAKLQKNRGQLAEELNQAAQRSGNLTVILTNAIAQHLGLSATDFECADILRHMGPMSAGQLAKLCALTTGGMTGLIDRLEAAGLARRVADPKDRRRVMVEAVYDPAVGQKLKELYRPLSEGFQREASRYNDQELAVIIQYYQNMNRLMERVLKDM